MRQSRRMSLGESLSNILVGLIVSVLANSIVFPWFGFHLTVGDNLSIAAIYTTISLVRSYCMRRFFEVLREQGVGQ